MSADRPTQSWQTALVDLAILGVLALFAIKSVKEPAAWTLLGAIVSGRFGVSFGKQLERVSTGGRQGPPSGPGGIPGGIPGTGTSGQYKLDLPSVPPPGMRRLAMLFTHGDVPQHVALMLVTALTAIIVVGWR